MHRKSYRATAALVLGLALTFPAPAFAGGTDKPDAPAASATGLAQLQVTREKAIAIAKQYFPIPADMGEPNININQSKDGAEWYLNWSTPSDQPNPSSIGVTVDAVTGEVRGYNHYQSKTDAPPAPTLTRTEALAKAQAWLDKLASAHKSELQLVDGDAMGYGNSGSYTFQWQRLLFSYPLASEGLTVAINATTGQLESYNLSWRNSNNAVMPASMLEKAKTEAVFQTQVPLELQYQYFTTPGTNSGEWRLVYLPALGQFPVVSQDGKVLDFTGAAVDTKAAATRTPVPAPDQPYQKPATPLTQEQALALAQKALGRKDAPTNSSYNESGEKEKFHSWNFSWYIPGTKENPNPDNANATVDVDLGVITNLSTWGNYDPLKEGEQPKVTREQAQDLAFTFLRTYRPDLAGQLVLLPNNSDRIIEWKLGAKPSSINFSFARLKNGIRIAGQDVSLDVNVRTGTIQNFWGNTNDNRTDKFPSPADPIPAATAIQSLLTQAGLTAFWQDFYPIDSGMAPGESQPQSQLVWGVNRTMPVQAIDARSGALLDYNGRDLVEAAKRPTDIDGHFAQREIELLWARGIFELKDGKFNPNAEVTAAELSRWLVLSRGFQPYMAYDFKAEFALQGASPATAANLASSTAAPYFGSALKNGIILPEDFAKDVDPNGPVSRELFALWAARAMGYSAVVKMPNKIEMPFADKAQIGEKYANAVALLNGLGVIKGDATAHFAPQRNLTRGEAAKILFAVASQSQPIWK